MSSTTKTVFITLGVVGVVGAIACCGGGMWMANYGMDLVTEQIQAQLDGHPQIQQHIGQVQSFEVDMEASEEIEDVDTFAYNISGSKGAGTLTIKSESVDADTEKIEAATLTMSDGTVIEIDASLFP